METKSSSGNPLKIVATLTAITATFFFLMWHDSKMAAVAPQNQESEFYHQIKARPGNHAKQLKSERTLTGGQTITTVIEGLKRSARRNRKIFGAAQFICILPLEKHGSTETCSRPSEAVEAVRKLKAAGYDEIRVSSMTSAEVYDAIVRTAREEDIRINA